MGNLQALLFLIQHLQLYSVGKAGLPQRRDTVGLVLLSPSVNPLGDN